MPHAVAGVERAGKTNSHLLASAMLEPQAPTSQTGDRMNRGCSNVIISYFKGRLVGGERK